MEKEVNLFNPAILEAFLDLPSVSEDNVGIPLQEAIDSGGHCCGGQKHYGGYTTCKIEDINIS